MQKRVRVVVGVAVMAAVFIASVGVAGARWTRGFSDINSFANDESICENAWTISASLDDSRDYSSDPNPPVLGDVRPTTIHFYASAEDALFVDPVTFQVGRNPIASILINQIFVELIPGDGVNTADKRIWHGETTVTPPPGYPNGTVIYTRALSDQTSDTVAIPLTVGGEARYNCPVAAAPFEFKLLSPGNRLYLRALLPHVIAFRSAGIDLRSIKIGTDDTVAKPALAFSVKGIGFALFSPKALGTTCAATKLLVTGKKLDGTPLAGSVNVTPIGGCPAG